MEKLSIIGYVGADAEVKKLENIHVANFNVCVSKSYTNKDGVKVESNNWYKCAKWDKNFPEVAKFIKKGDRIYVEGEPGAEAYIHEQTREARSGLTLKVSFLELLGTKKENESEALEPATPEDAFNQ